MLKKYTCIYAVLLMIIGCTETDFYFKQKKTSGGMHKDSIFKFNFENKDTITPYDMFIHIRNTNEYKFDNLFLITSLQFPNGKIVVDTLEYKMAYPNGELMGEGFGSLKHNKLWYKENYNLNEIGMYELGIRQAMRRYNKTESLELLEGVEEVGFSYNQRKNNE